MTNDSTREILTPANWHWAITPQQVAEIKQGNRDTIKKVYFDNLLRFRQIVKGFCNKRNVREFCEDCIQQIYLDLPRYRFDNDKVLYFSIRQSIYRALGYSYNSVNFNDCLSIYGVINGYDEDELTLGDTIKASAYIDEMEVDEQNKRVIEIIETQPQLTEAQKDFLTSVAFGCSCYRGLYEQLCAMYK